MADTKVNGVKHSWASIEAVDLGYGTMEDVQEISWETKQDNKLRYGRGTEPTGMALGNVEYSGQIVMSRDEFDDSFWPWVTGTGAKKLSELEPFSLEISRKRHANDTLKTTRLKGVKLGGDQNSVSQGGTDWNVTIPFIFLDKEEIGIGG